MFQCIALHKNHLRYRKRLSARVFVLPTADSSSSVALLLPPRHSHFLCTNKAAPTLPHGLTFPHIYREFSRLEHMRGPAGSSGVGASCEPAL